MNCFLKISLVLAFAGSMTSALAQEVSIPDPSLNAALRDALQKPAGPLTAQDLLSLNNLRAGGKGIGSVEGLESAGNLLVLDLDGNSITNFSIGGALTNLQILDLFHNHLTNFANAPATLTILDLSFNSIGQISLPDGLTNLDTLFADGNVFTNFTLPAGLTAMTQLQLSENSITSFTVRPEMTNLISLNVSFNQLTSLTLPPTLGRLTGVELDNNHLSNLNLPGGLTNLILIIARDNQLTNLTIPVDMENLVFLDFGENQLSNFTLPAGLFKLNFLRFADNKLTNFALPLGLTNLTSLFLQNNQLTNISLPTGLNDLVQIDLRTNNLTSLTLPPDMTNLTTLDLDGNPLTTLVLSEPMASKLAGVVASLENRGVNVLTYPLSVRLTRVRQPIAAFQFVITGPPGAYTVLQSTNLLAWSAMRSVTNSMGAVTFTDGTANLSPQKFYTAVIQAPSPTQAPTNMVFIPANTFTLGSPTNEIGHQSDESPQTIVTLSHGFWMAKYLVTQRDYLAVMGSNPSGFPGNLDRPVETVSWFDATNYCDKLTQQDLAAGRIPAGSHYRLPTEAEWECAARAGTTTRFNYGDDAASLTNHAWYSANSGLKPNPVGLKEPNAWGLYDMEGNVWEWCEDWYGPYPGGAVTDPQGPASNAIGFKVIRGGAWESSETDCRSARRSIEGACPFITDFIIGFRVVLELEP